MTGPGAPSAWGTPGSRSYQVLPGLVSATVVIATLQVARVVLAEAFRSSLGLGSPGGIIRWNRKNP